MELISWWWSIVFALLLFLLGIGLFQQNKDEVGGLVLLVSIALLFLGPLFTDIYNFNIEQKLKARKDFVAIQQSWQIIEVVDEPSKPSDVDFDPRYNIYLVERVQNGCLLRGKILRGSTIEIVDVKAVGPVSLIEKKTEAVKVEQMTK